MRKITKPCELSREYKEWEETLEKSRTPHPDYPNPRKHYLDVAMNLFYCQDGLCAYTEMRLCSKKYYDKKNWKKKKWKNTIHSGRPEFGGNLEHFDKNIKPNQSWLWSNLFMVDTDVNTKVKRI